MNVMGTQTHESTKGKTHKTHPLDLLLVCRVRPPLLDGGVLVAKSFAVDELHIVVVDLGVRIHNLHPAVGFANCRRPADHGVHVDQGLLVVSDDDPAIPDDDAGRDAAAKLGFWSDQRLEERPEYAPWQLRPVINNRFRRVDFHDGDG